jgi:hypothetical protein
MKRILTIAAVTSLLFAFGLPGTDYRKNYAETITATSLKTHLSILASDEYEGRETAQKGQKMAAAYIAARFREFGLKPLPGKENDTSLSAYYQDVPLLSKQAGAGSVKDGTREYAFGKDFYYTPGIEDGDISTEEIVFAGYGIQDSLYRDYDGMDVKGKTVIVLADEPLDKKGNSILTGKKELSSWSTQRRRKWNEAKNRGAKALFIVQSDFSKSYETNKHHIESPTLELYEETLVSVITDRMMVLYISREMANSLLANGKTGKTAEKQAARIGKKKKPASFSFKLPVSVSINRTGSILHSENVLGYLEGSDLKNELLVVTAHYDHLGKDGAVVFNGADDDGTGTVSVIAMAEAFSKAKKEGHGPRRSILFMTVTGEEKGLLGSDWYTRHPVYPLAQTVCDLNIDMIGRVDKDHEKDTNYVYVIGSDRLSSELKKISEESNARYTGLTLDYRFDVPNEPNSFYTRSDHYNFAKNGVPVAFFFNGVHADYHKETDEVQKVLFPLMVRRAQLVFYTAWEIASRDKRLVVDKKKS